jgi:serine/threonine protein kinase
MPSGDTPDLNLLFPQRTAAAEQKLFGRYTLKRVLGRGGMGVVWMARDDELQRNVAMKFLPDMLIRDREAVNDLKRETRRSLDLTHHHIVRIYDFTQDDVCAAIIMEYVDGETLSAMKTHQVGGCFSVSTIAAWVGHFCQALDYAHRQARVVHRDLKPANLMVNSRGDLKVTDFGISRSMSDSMTRVSMSNTAGTLAYMSPEQALGAPPAPCDDIYAFGATVYDLLTGRPPFFRGNIQVQLETVIPPKMADRREELGNQGEPIPELWEEMMKACLAKRPQDRPQTMGEIAGMLGLASSASPVRTTFPGGIPTGHGTGGPGTASTLTRPVATDDAATRTDALPPAPQTTRRATPGTHTGATSYVPTPKPTELRDVIPGYIEEPAEPPVTTPPTAQPPATTPTRLKAEEAPSAPSLPPPVEPEPSPEPVVAEVPVQIEAPAEIETPPVAEAAPPVEEPKAVEMALALEIPSPEVSEEAVAEVDVADVAEAEKVSEEPAESLEKEVVVEATPEPEPEPEIETPEDVVEAEPSITSASVAAPEPEEFPTLVGKRSIEPRTPSAEDIQTIELPAPEVVEEPVSIPLKEAKAEIAEERMEEAAAPMDEAAETLVDAPLPELESSVPVPVPAPVPAILEPSPPPPAEIEQSGTTIVEEAVSSPSRRRSLPWLPIAAAVGVAAIVGIWMGMPKDDANQNMAIVPNPQPLPVQPTPVPIAHLVQPKLEQARIHIGSEEFTEATALLNEVQGLDPNNADAAALLTQVDVAKRKKADMEALAERDRKVSQLIDESRAAKQRRNLVEARAKLREARMLDFENSIIKSELDAVDSVEMAQKQAEEEAKAQANREQADMKAAADARAAEAKQEEARREAERKRMAAQEEPPQKKAKAVTPRPSRERVRESNDSSDRPPKKPVATREDQRPPTPSRNPPKVRATPAPVNRGTAPGG